MLFLYPVEQSLVHVVTVANSQLTIECAIAFRPVIAVTTITIDGKYDPFTPPGDGAAYRDKFSGKYAHETLPVGHNVPQEAPRDFAQAVVDVNGY
jgi:pimeloyl-ACP methyl ester carboxylesterase